ncbi:hypothetical protein [Limnovirga soli]|uniref:Uncharacterized protein n=1 Tax=Limnovirga soli TaxID=2656915 RepID=A0A8J8JSX2_9BACT|nr:hypothetical protein [Limnovirga soli]NNV55248.1 hypothetical protein [Limnovirga soli]
MTPKQIERIQKKIARIRQTLAAEKRRFGCYDDSRGLRYLSTQYFIQLGDYAGGLRYTRWFEKNFPDDCGFPAFLFEWTIILFKTGKTKAAEKKAFQTFCSNIWLFDKYFGKITIPFGKLEGSNKAIPAFIEDFPYSSEQVELADFSNWLIALLNTPDFILLSKKYIDIQIRLITERDLDTRYYLVHTATELEQTFKL